MKFQSRLLVLGLIAASTLATAPAQPIGAEVNFEGEILTRGPVHEAFAAVVTYNPEAGVVVDRAPPEPIEEMPPEERPVDVDTAWIPGYWAWDDERNDFIWISGTWRVLPPGRAWIGGYWRETGRGWQWVTGYWEDADRREVVYLSPPPESLERGPSSPQPTPNHEWVPGHWDWMDGRYLWRPGYWLEGRAGWVWVPSYYIWTPRGHVFVDGYWDYAPAERGLLFAPVYYADHRRPRSYYRPSIVLNIAILSDYLFLRPRYSHYYFGDYYDSRYESAGFYASFSYQSSRRGYDPFYSYSRWRNRDDRDWDRRHRESYDYRRSHVDARPPRTWSGTTITVNVNQNINLGSRDSRSVTYAQPIQQYARSNDAPVRVERSTSRNFDQQVQVARQVQEQRSQRRTMESQSGATVTAPSPTSRDARIGASGRQQATVSAQSAAVALPTSPIVAREGSGRHQPPPRAQAPRREESSPDRRAERQAQQPDPRDVVTEQSAIGSTPAPGSRYEAPRGGDRRLRADNSAAVESRRLEEQAQQEEQRQAQEAARRNARQAQEQVRSQQQEIGQPGQGRDRADERRAVEAQERAAQQQERQSRQVEPMTDEQLRRDQERQAQQRGQDRQAQQQRADERYQQAEAQQQAREQQGRAVEQERAQQRRAAEQQQQAQAMEQERAQQSRAAEAQAREQQARAVEQERAQQNRAAEQAREQQARAAEQQQAREQQARAAEQERNQQAQAAEQERAQQVRAAEQAREQQARAAQQAEAAKQKAAPNRDKKQPPKKSKEELEEEERQKRKGGTE